MNPYVATETRSLPTGGKGDCNILCSIEILLRKAQCLLSCMCPQRISDISLMTRDDDTTFASSIEVIRSCHGMFLQLYQVDNLNAAIIDLLHIPMFA
jgi:hypothetical protein